MRFLVTVCCKGLFAAALLGALALGSVGCGADGESNDVVLVTHDSFAISDDVRAEFEETSGLELRILQSGDAGELLSKALLTAGNPQGDVLFGVDNNLLSRALDGDLFEPYESPGLENVDAGYMLDPEHRVTPIDHGEVCLNYDKAWFSEREIEPPRSLDDLTAPAVRGHARRRERGHLTPGARLPARDGRPLRRGGLAGLLAARLRENRVLVVDGWEEAYNVRFSGAAGKGTGRSSSPTRRARRGGDLRHATPGRGSDRRRRGQLLPADRVRGRPARERGTKRARASSWTSCSTSASRRTFRSRCSSSRSTRAQCSPGVREVRRRPGEPTRAVARRDRGEPRPVGERVDANRASLSAHAWRALTYGVPLAFLALFFAFPLASILERGLGSGEGVRRRSTSSPTR